MSQHLPIRRAIRPPLTFGYSPPSIPPSIHASRASPSFPHRYLPFLFHRVASKSSSSDSIEPLVTVVDPLRYKSDHLLWQTHTCAPSRAYHGKTVVGFALLSIDVCSSMSFVRHPLDSALPSRLASSSLSLSSV